MRFRNLFGSLRRNSKFSVVERPYSDSKASGCSDGKHRALRDKVAIVTGGASGIGLQCVKEFLKRGAVGVTIADVNNCNGERAVKSLCDEFGKGRAMYVKCDVTKSDQFDWAYKQTLKFYRQIDVVVNNAGIMNDIKWEHSIATNIGGCLVGSLLAIQYMSKTSIGRGGTVINVACLSGIAPYCGAPIYSTTQSAIVTFSRALGTGQQYERTGVKIITLCVGPTNTTSYLRAPTHTINDKFQRELEDEMEDHNPQRPAFVAKTMTGVMVNARSGSVWVVANGNAPYQIKMPDNLHDLKIVKNTERNIKNVAECQENEEEEEDEEPEKCAAISNLAMKCSPT